MNVIIIGRGYPTKDAPLNGVFEFDQAKALASIGLNVKYFAFDTRSIKNRRAYGIKRYYENKLEIIRVDFPIGKIPFHNILNKMIYKFVMASILKDMKGKVIIHSHFLSIAERMNLIPTNNIKYVHTEHYSSLNQEVYSENLKMKCENLFKHYDLIFAVSEKFKKNLMNNLSINVQVMPNIIDTEHFNFISKKHNSNNGLNFVYVGRLDENKSVFDLLKAFDIHAEYFSDATLSIIGTGPQLSELKDHLLIMKNANRVKFYGQINRDEINKLFNHKDVFISLSKKETFGVAFVEALASGLPIISRDNGGVNEYIEYNNGMIIGNDVEDAVQAMNKMTLEFERFNLEEISRQILTKYSPNIIAENLKNYYSQLLGE